MARTSAVEHLTGTPPSIPSRYFYDERGSRLFEAITRLPECYQTRTEESLLEAAADELIEAVRPRELVQLGCGVGRKIRPLLDRLQRSGASGRCVLLDINGGSVRQSVAAVQATYPALEVRGVVGDFVEDLEALGRVPWRRLLLFLGGTIGNLHPAQVPSFLRRASGVMAPGDGLLVGIDELYCKYTRESFAALLSGTPLRIESWLTDPEGSFALALLRRAVG